MFCWCNAALTWGTLDISQIKRLCKAGFRTEKDAMPEVNLIKSMNNWVKGVDISTHFTFSSIMNYSSLSYRRINVYNCDRALRHRNK
jgi:hypothetical protein